MRGRRNAGQDDIALCVFFTASLSGDFNITFTLPGRCEEVLLLFSCPVIRAFSSFCCKRYLCQRADEG